MEATKKPSLLTGALVGGMLMIALIALFFLAFRLLGLPFAPFDVIFPGIRDLTPGDLITFVIDTIVDLIGTFNLGRTDAAAKTIEQLMALGMTLGIGVVTGAVVFNLANRMKVKNRFLPGLWAGIILGVVMILFFTASGLSVSADQFISALWLFVAFVGFGVALSWIYYDLSVLRLPSEAATGTQQGLDRREFIVRVGGATATLTVLGTGLGALLEGTGQDAASSTIVIPETTPQAVASTVTLSDATYVADLEAAAGTRPEYTPLDDHYRIDISARPPALDASSWRLRISGLVDAPVEMTLDEIINNFDPMEQLITMGCISNRVGGDLISTTRWTGVRMQTLIDSWNLKPEATHLRISSADGFDEYVDLSTIRDDDRVMLAYAWDGQALKQKHGFPVRIYIPDHYGMKQPKWITDIEVVDSWDEGYWVRRGWSVTAFVQTTAVLDTVASSAVFERDGQQLVPVGGIAWAGARGIAQVEVSVDEGEWQAAQLKTPQSELTWVIWRYDWPFAEGNHTFRVRCVDGTGTPQTESVQDVRPDGATGIHSMRASL